ncbi:MAG: PspC domain-containing protein [Muribaculaceae bacterium]|nr:PspC domain-containing protein [Muribaculaceae bacterium]
MNKKRLTRSSSDKKIAGVCSGIAKFLGLDPTLVRLAYALLTIFTAFAGVLIYIIMMLIVPEE